MGDNYVSIFNKNPFYTIEPVCHVEYPLYSNIHHNQVNGALTNAIDTIFQDSFASIVIASEILFDGESTYKDCPTLFDTFTLQAPLPEGIRICCPQIPSSWKLKLGQTIEPQSGISSVRVTYTAPPNADTLVIAEGTVLYISTFSSVVQSGPTSTVTSADLGAIVQYFNTLVLGTSLPLKVFNPLTNALVLANPPPTFQQVACVNYYTSGEYEHTFEVQFKLVDGVLSSTGTAGGQIVLGDPISRIYLECIIDSVNTMFAAIYDGVSSYRSTPQSTTINSSVSIALSTLNQPGKFLHNYPVTLL